METKDVLTILGFVVGPVLGFVAAFALEHRRTRLGMESKEHEIRYKVRYEKLSSVLSDLSKKLNDVKQPLQKLILLDVPPGEKGKQIHPSQEEHELFECFESSLQDVRLFIEDHRLYIQDSIYNLIDNMLVRYSEIATGYMYHLRILRVDDLHDKALEAMQVQQEVFAHIRRLFRQALELQEFCH